MQTKEDNLQATLLREWMGLSRRLERTGGPLLGFLVAEARRSGAAPESDASDGGLGTGCFPGNIGCIKVGTKTIRGVRFEVQEIQWVTCAYDLTVEAGVVEVQHHLRVAAPTPDEGTCPFQGNGDFTLQIVQALPSSVDEPDVRGALTSFYAELSQRGCTNPAECKYSLVFGHGLDSITAHPGLPGGRISRWDILNAVDRVIGCCIAQVSQEDPDVVLVDRIFYDAITAPVYQRYQLVPNHDVSHVEDFLRQNAERRSGCHEVMLILRDLACPL